ncbi:MAG TPA: M20/M25/M40 family metallo-hydrolase [Actinomycetota bacterium]|nr:M20/M25/M40 family metallo-hydrolase [Actinomycetota bacterium]
MTDVAGLVRERVDRYVGWLTEACSIPSMAGDPPGLSAMAKWVEDKLTALGAGVERLVHEEAPDTLLGVLGTGDKTLLFYDHYDVQPVDPLDEWRSPPFTPEIRDGLFFARGAADNKGDLVARLAALEVYQEVHGPLPYAVKFLVEGEEETGSKSFHEIVERNRDKLAADGCIWEGQGIDHAGRPALVFGAKGLAYVELNYRGLKEDQHSSFAVYAPSPVWHMVEALATLRAPDGRVLIDGFYDDVEAPTDEDIAILSRFPFEEEAERERLGTSRFVGDVTGLEFLKRYFFEPTCNIAGIVSGYTVRGASKTVLPKQAMAKLDMRLVPNQDPDDIVEKLRKHLDDRGYGDITIDTFSMEHPVRSRPGFALGKAAISAAEEVFDLPPAVAPMMIATGPMHVIARALGVPTVSPAGVYRPTSDIHAPNENCSVEDYLKIIEYTVSYLDLFARTD